MMRQLRDREEAGRLLAKKLAHYSNRNDVLVLGLPRGGVEVAYTIARALAAPLDVLIVRKLGVPGYQEFAMGAVSIGGARFIDLDAVEEFHLSQDEVEKIANRELNEVARREREYRGPRPPLDVRGRTIILADDGIATGSTMRVAIATLKKLGAARVIVAVGAALLSTHMLLGAEADEVVSLIASREFRAVSQFYKSFPQVTDEEVRSILHRPVTPEVRRAVSNW